MQPPPNAKLIETPIFTMWVDESGILCFISKKHPAQTLEDSKHLFKQIKEISQGKKRFMLMDLTNFKMPDREAREYGARELPNMVTAIAFLSRSMLGAWVANMFFTINQQPYPTKMFTGEQEAKEWLERHL